MLASTTTGVPEIFWIVIVVLVIVALLMWIVRH